MEAVQLFLNINKPGLNNEWNKKITSSLKAFSGINEVLVIEKNETSEAQINIGYDIYKTSLDDLQSAVENSGAAITEINIHLPSGISGVSSPYGASAIALAIIEKTKSIQGISEPVISAHGEVKFTIDPTVKYKQNLVKEVIESIELIR